MRNLKSKMIKREIYGKDYSPRFRTYHEATRITEKRIKGSTHKQKFRTGYLVADNKRHEYQEMKKDYNKLTRKERGAIVCG